MCNVIAELEANWKSNVLSAIGLGSLVNMSSRQLHRDFCFYLLECFDVDTLVIHYHRHEISLGVEDFVSILGLKNEGRMWKVCSRITLRES